MLTDLSCRKAEPRAKPYKIFDAHGLFLYVTPAGSRLWRFKYRFEGKEKLLTFGAYPLVSLQEARQKRDDVRRLLFDGTDPVALRREMLEATRAREAVTFERVAREWHTAYKERWSEGHGATILHRLEMDIFPAIGNRPISAIFAPELLKAIRRIEDRGAPEMARRATQICGQVFRYAIVTGCAERNPAEDLKGALRPFRKGHFAAFDSSALPSFLHKLDSNEARLYPQTRLALKLLALTFVRTSELIEATWDEFNLDEGLWSIPASRMKMRRPHIVPLSRQAVAVLRQLKALAGNRPYILPSQINPRKHMSNNTILKALERMGYKGQMTGHGFRALAMSTIKEKLGYRHEVVDRQLAHAPRNKVDAAYDRAQFLDERTVMMQRWADYLDEQLRKDRDSAVDNSDAGLRIAILREILTQTRHCRAELHKIERSCARTDRKPEAQAAREQLKDVDSVMALLITLLRKEARLDSH